MLWPRLLSFRYAFQGIGNLLRTQPNARIHLLATVAVLAFGWYLHLSPSEWCIIIVCISAVWAAEAFNTAVEYLVDLVSPQYHPLAGKAKDVAAAAVLICAIGACLVGFIIFGPKIEALLF